MRWFLIFTLLTAYASQKKDPTRKLRDKSIRNEDEKGDYFLPAPFFRLWPVKIPVIKEGVVVAYLFVHFEAETLSK